MEFIQNFYVETNLLCLIVSLWHIYQIMRSNDKSPRRMTFVCILAALAVACVSEALFGALYNTDASVKSLQIIRSVYNFCINLDAYFWFIYLERSQKSLFVESALGKIIYAVPVIISEGLLLSGKLFFFDDGGFHRGEMVFLQALLCFVPIFISSCKAFIRSFKKKYYVSRSEFVLFSLSVLIMMTSFFVNLPKDRNTSLICMEITIIAVFVYESYQDKMISTDPLTGLNNRNSLEKFLTQKINNAEDKIFLVLIDIDNFKGLNDNFGHAEGDNALLMLAEVLKRTVPSKYTITRYGGDEFVLAGHSDSEDEVIVLKRKILYYLERENLMNGKNWNMTVSIGYAECKGETDNIPDLIRAADEEMYREKAKIHS